MFAIGFYLVVHLHSSSESAKATISNGFARFSLVMCVLSALVFMTELTAYNSVAPGYTGPAFAILYLLFGVILLPIWTFTAGFRILPKLVPQDDVRSINLGEVNEAYRPKLRSTDADAV